MCPGKDHSIMADGSDVMGIYFVLGTALGSRPAGWALVLGIVRKLD